MNERIEEGLRIIGSFFQKIMINFILEENLKKVYDKFSF